MAWAARPSPRPVKPSLSVVVARTVTHPGSEASAAASRSCIFSRREAIRGSSPIEDAIRVDQFPAGCAHFGVGASEQVERVGALPALFARGKERADVSQPGRAEQGVDQRVCDHVTVRVPRKTTRVFDADTAQHERHAVREGMRVDAEADSELAHCLSSSSQLSTRARSSAVVTFCRRRSPSTQRTRPPRLSTSAAQSVASSCSSA